MVPVCNNTSCLRRVLLLTIRDRHGEHLKLIAKKRSKDQRARCVSKLQNRWQHFGLAEKGDALINDQPVPRSIDYA